MSLIAVQDIIKIINNMYAALVLQHVKHALLILYVLYVMMAYICFNLLVLANVKMDIILIIHNVIAA